MFRYSAATIVIIVLMIGAPGCKPDYPNCAKDSHCLDGEYCVNNICQQCRDNGDCPEGQACAEGGCREIPGYCSDSTDCSEGQICRDQRCGPCLTNGDCASEQVCMDGRCGKAECNSAEDCPAGLNCVAYRCLVETTTGTQDEEQCSLEPVLFEFDSSEMDDKMRSTAESNYRCLQQDDRNVVLEGHCDPRGTTEYNMALGERRAKGIRKYLVNLGMERGKVRVVSKGEEEATGTNESSWAQDRRVDFE